MLLGRTGTAHLKTGLTATEIALISVGSVLVLAAIIGFAVYKLKFAKSENKP